MDLKLSALKILKVGVIALATAIPFFSKAFAQELKIITKPSVYRQQQAQDSNYRMIELKTLIPDITYDLHYATTSNFTGQQLYRNGDKTFLRLPAAMALVGVQKLLKEKGLGIKVWDAYRPHGATKLMWHLVQDERYVANPAKGSGHNRGLAIDLTLIDLQTGTELDMGTGFDHFTDTAHHAFRALHPKVFQNRLLLKQTMEAAGFKALSTEWWHYYWPNDRNYDVLDIDFKKLQKKKPK